jgi:membrane protein DedA with SNARE-associated domain
MVMAPASDRINAGRAGRLGGNATPSTDLEQMTPPSADILKPIVDFSVNVIDTMGLAGVFILMMLGSACIPVPSEAVMLFAGFNVSTGDQTLVGIVLAGFAGNMVGSWLAYAAGYYGRIELLEKNRLVHLSPARLAWADQWFARHGDAAVFFTRMIPVVRAFISLPAGVARMPLGRFSLLTAAGSLPWVLGFGLLGRAVGSHWEQWRDHLHYLDYAVVAGVVALIAYALVRKRRQGPVKSEGRPEPAGGTGS